MHLDLNLLTALDALLEEGGVTAAADRLHLSAPAMSRTLGRLRRTTGDQVLVRTGRTMTPTPYALAVREQVHALVAQAAVVLTPDRDLDLATLDRVFTLRVHDAIATVVGPALVDGIRVRAPGVRLRLLGEAAGDTDDLRHGRVDVEIGSGGPRVPEICVQVVASDRLVAVVRPGHPLAGTPLTLAGYAGALHAIVSRRGRLRDPVDDVLAVHGLHRRVVASLPTTTAGLCTARHSEVVVTGPDRMCRPLIDALGLLTLTLPLDLAPVPVEQAWHQRYTTDPAHAWLREQIRGVVHDALGDTTDPPA